MWIHSVQQVSRVCVCVRVHAIPTLIVLGFLFQVLVHLGLLTKESGFKIAESAFSGGPLGELVQWSDLITSLYLLGHDIRISASLAELKE